MSEQAENRAKGVVVAYASGTAPKEELDGELVLAWKALLADPTSAADAARILQTDAHTLRSIEDPPFRLEPRQQGIGVVETAIVVFVGQVGYDLCKDLAKEAARDALKQLWSVIKARMEFKLPLGAFGRETRVE